MEQDTFTVQRSTVESGMTARSTSSDRTNNLACPSFASDTERGALPRFRELRSTCAGLPTEQQERSILWVRRDEDAAAETFPGGRITVADVDGQCVGAVPVLISEDSNREGDVAIAINAILGHASKCRPGAVASESNAGDLGGGKKLVVRHVVVAKCALMEAVLSQSRFHVQNDKGCGLKVGENKSSRSVQLQTRTSAAKANVVDDEVIEAHGGVLVDQSKGHGIRGRDVSPGRFHVRPAGGG